MHWTIVIAFPLLVCAGCSSLSRTFMNVSWRDRWQQPQAVIQSLAIKPSDHVADLGAGGGYFTFRLAKAVGPTGKVYAVDVNRDHLEYITQAAKKGGYANVEVILAKYDDPLLPENGIDLIFTCNTYHHIENRVAYFASVTRVLHPNGRIAIIDLNGKHWFSWLFGHWTPAETIRSEMESAGYRLTNEFDFLSRQNFQVFAKNP